MKQYISITLVFIMISFVGCSEEKTYPHTPDFTGVVLSFEDRTHIKMDIKSGKITNVGYGGEIVLSVESSKDIENLKKGEEIRVWIDGELLESQPPQGSLGKYETIQ